MRHRTLCAVVCVATSWAGLGAAAARADFTYTLSIYPQYYGGGLDVTPYNPGGTVFNEPRTIELETFSARFSYYQHPNSFNYGISLSFYDQLPVPNIDSGYYLTGTITFTPHASGTDPAYELDGTQTVGPPQTDSSGSFIYTVTPIVSFSYHGNPMDNTVSGLISAYVTATPIPEPASVALFALGAAGAWLGARRRTRGRGPAAPPG